MGNPGKEPSAGKVFGIFALYLFLLAGGFAALVTVPGMVVEFSQKSSVSEAEVAEYRDEVMTALQSSHDGTLTRTQIQHRLNLSRASKTAGLMLHLEESGLVYRTGGGMGEGWELEQQYKKSGGEAQ